MRRMGSPRKWGSFFAFYKWGSFFAFKNRRLSGLLLAKLAVASSPTSHENFKKVVPF